MFKMIFTVVGTLIGLGAFSQPHPPTPDDPALRKKQFNTPDGIGVKGYDPVAYFTGNQAVKGSKDQAVVYEGITYYFSSAANRDAFKKDPARYEPQYGGWCAYAMGATGEKVEVDPETFKIIDGKLYLFDNKFFNIQETDLLPVVGQDTFYFQFIDHGGHGLPAAADQAGDIFMGEKIRDAESFGCILAQVLFNQLPEKMEQPCLHVLI